MKLSLSFIVRNTLRFRCSGLAGGEGEDEKNNNVRHDVVEVDRQAELLKSAYSVAVDVEVGVCRADALQKSEQERSEGDAHRLPVTEDHNGEGEEAHTCDRTLCCTRGDGGDVDVAAHTCKSTRDGSAEISHPVHVDTDAVRRLRMLTASAKAKTVLCLIEEYRQDDKEYYNDVGRDKHLIEEGL